MKRFFSIMAALMCISLVAAMPVELKDILINSPKVERNGKDMLVYMHLDLTKLSVGSNRAVVIKPCLVNGNDSLVLPAVGVYGRNRYIYYQRHNGETMLTGKDAAKQAWVPDTGSLPASLLDTAKYKSPVTGNNVPADEICEVNKPAYLVICPSADNISMTNEEQMKSVYTSLINAVKAKSPNTKIICCSLTPIASNYQYEDITNELIQKVNGWIAAAAESNSVKYLDMASGLVGDDGFLPQTYQDGDGMHLNAEGMKAWMTYLRTHAYP